MARYSSLEQRRRVLDQYIEALRWRTRERAQVRARKRASLWTRALLQLVCSAHSPYIDASFLWHPVRRNRMRTFLLLCALAALLGSARSAPVTIYQYAQRLASGNADARTMERYNSMSASANAACRLAAAKVAVSYMYALDAGIDERTFSCLMDCAGLLSVTCADVLLLNTFTCASVAASVCASNLRDFYAAAS